MNIEEFDKCISDEQLIKLLDGKDEGKSFPEALSLLGLAKLSEKETHELRSLWDMHGDLTREVHAISPDPRLLEGILTRFSANVVPSVTEVDSASYHREGVSSIFMRIINNIHSLMQMNWKIATPIAVFALAVVAIIGLGGKQGAIVPATEVNPQVALRAEPPMAKMMAVDSRTLPVPPVENGDDLAMIVAFEAEGDLTLLADTDQDLSLVSSDGTEITGFTNTYDETSF